MMQLKFENDVKTYGTQAQSLNLQLMGLFENDVKTYGTQAVVCRGGCGLGLRMM